ncbi:hypothetical protein IJ750_00515 [bacterium]|nr:hypothetical protein [bacterium]
MQNPNPVLKNYIFSPEIRVIKEKSECTNPNKPSNNVYLEEMLLFLYATKTK